MTPDISQLGLQEPDQVEWDQYQVTGGPQAPPPAGTYQVVAPEKFDYTAKDSKLIVLVDPIEVIGPTASGHKIRFTRISTKKYSNREASPAGDYLKAQGSLARPRSNQDYVDAFEATAGRPFTVDLDWEAYDKDDGYTIKGMSNFPDDGKGGKQFVVKNPNTGNTLRARARITRFRAFAG